MDRRNNEEWPAIGIDLGTSYSCVGIWLNGHVNIIPNDQGSRMTPSCVAFTDTQRLIGEAAVNQGRTNSSNTIYDIKRLIGRRFNDEVVQKDLKNWPFEVINGRENKPLIRVTYMGKNTIFYAEEISAMILMKMKDTAEAYLGKSVKNAVVTVPAYFTDSQRQATLDAGAVAGLNVLRLLNEPTAAAIAYGFDKKMSNNKISRENVVVFDLGGGTFDVSLVSIKGNTVQVKSVCGDTHLGGSDFDNRMVHYFVEEFKRKHNKDASGDRRALERLRLACEKAKRALSLIPQTSIEIDYLYDGIDFSSTISRECFDNLNDDLFRKCIDLVEQCLSNARINKKIVDEIILIGGSTRIPKVQQLLQNFFKGKELSKSLNPDEAVAYGAALNAAAFCGLTNNNIMVPVDVNPFPIYVETSPGNVSYVVSRNKVIPMGHMGPLGNKNRRRALLACIKACLKFVFAYIKDFLIYVFPCMKRKRQSTNGMKTMVFEGERSKPQGNNFLGFFESYDFNQPSNIDYEFDINGILSISAKDSRNGTTNVIDIIDPSRLTKLDLETMTSTANEYKALDKKYEENVKAKNKLEEYANDMNERLSDSGREIGTKEKSLIDEIQQVLNWLESNSKAVRDAAEYMEKLQVLKSKCKSI